MYTAFAATATASKLSLQKTLEVAMEHILLFRAVFEPLPDFLVVTLVTVSLDGIEEFVGDGRHGSDADKFLALDKLLDLLLGGAIEDEFLPLFLRKM